MTQQVSPFLEAAWGWNLGESNWNLGADENWLKFSYMFDATVNGIVSSLPTAVTGEAYFLTTDNRLYYAVNNTFHSTSVPKYFIFKNKVTGAFYQFNGTSAVVVDSPTQLNSRITATESGLSGLSANLLNSSDPLKGAGLVGFMNRFVRDKLKDTVSVKDYGAVGDGVANDTVAIQAALDYLNSIGGGRLYFPKGVYTVNKLTTYSNIWLCGDGRDNTVIKLRNAQNTDLLYGALSDTRWLTAAAVGNTNTGLFDITLDGNRANNTAGSCFANYGDDVYMQNVFITQAAEWGIRTDYFNGEDAYGMEGHFINVKIDTCGKDGWRFDGPHDSVVVNCTVIDASKLANATYDGIRVGSRCNARFVGCHVWNRSTSFRHRYAVNLEVGGGGNEFSTCHFEGAQVANVFVACNTNIFDPSTRLYYPWNGVNMILAGTAAANNVRCTFVGPFTGQPQAYAIVLGNTAGDTPSYNTIDIHCIDCRLGAIWFNFSGGFNQIKARGFWTSGAASFGTPATTDRVDILAPGATPSSTNTVEQATTLTVAASSTVSWTFPFAFNGNPKVMFSIRSPSGVLDGHSFISALSPTAVTITNSSTRTMTYDVIAFRL